MSEVEGTQVQEPVIATKAKKAVNVIGDIAQEVEGLTKTKALNEANRLADTIDQSFFKLGGVLKVIHDNHWYEGYESFADYVSARFEFQERKAKYLMQIYDDLVVKQIPYEKVHHLGWTKLIFLSRVLTLSNVDEWVAKAENLTVAQLRQILAGDQQAATGTTPAKTTSDTTKMTFTLKADQVETVQSALNKVKAELGTEFDSVGLENICLGYLGGSISMATPDLAATMQSLGWKQVLTVFGTVYPDIDISIDNAPAE
jgi:hypothetical protein